MKLYRCLLIALLTVITSIWAESIHAQSDVQTKAEIKSYEQMVYGLTHLDSLVLRAGFLCNKTDCYTNVYDENARLIKTAIKQGYIDSVLYKYQGDHLIQEISFSQGDTVLLMNQEFTTDGKLSKQVVTGSMTDPDVRTYHFNHLSQHIETLFTLGDQEGREKFVYSLDGALDDKLIYQKSDSGLFRIIERISYDYYENGDLRSERYYNESNKLVKRLYFRYDKDGRIVNRQVFDAQDELLKDESYEYNSFGFITMYSQVLDGQEDRYTYDYSYDEQFNWVVRIENLNGKAVKESLRTYIYRK